MARYLTSTLLVKVLDIAHVYGIDVTVIHNNLPSGDVNFIFVPKFFTNDEHALGYMIQRGEEIENIFITPCDDSHLDLLTIRGKVDIRSNPGLH